MGAADTPSEKKKILIIHHTIFFDGLIAYFDARASPSFDEGYTNYAYSQFIIRTLFQARLDDPIKGSRLATTSSVALKKVEQKLIESKKPKVGAYELASVLEGLLDPAKDEQISKFNENDSIIATTVDIFESGSEIPIPVVSSNAYDNLIDSAVNFYKTNRKFRSYKPEDLPFQIYTVAEAKTYLETKFEAAAQKAKEAMRSKGIVCTGL